MKRCTWIRSATPTEEFCTNSISTRLSPIFFEKPTDLISGMNPPRGVVLTMGQVRMCKDRFVHIRVTPGALLSSQQSRRFLDKIRPMRKPTLTGGRKRIGGEERSRTTTPDRSTIINQNFATPSDPVPEIIGKTDASKKPPLAGDDIRATRIRVETSTRGVRGYTLVRSLDHHGHRLRPPVPRSKTTHPGR